MSLSHHKIAVPLSIAEIIDQVDEPVQAVFGEEALIIDAVASLGGDKKGSLVFCKAKGLKAQGLIKASQATAVLISPDVNPVLIEKKCYLQVADPARWFVRALTALFSNPPHQEENIHPSAVIEKGATIGNGCHIGPGTFIGANVTLGADCKIGPNCSLGVSGLAVAFEEDGTPLAYPHLGRVILGDRVRIGANCVIVRGILENTEIGSDCQLGNMVNIGHNCRVGENCWISTKALLCGSVTLNQGVMVGAGATLNNHVTVGAGANIGLGSVVTKSITSGQSVFGNPAKPLPTMRSLK
jgi:UDP-3-O-[3-hydroxymyristoyl] glucosamine N-acyltransferase